LFQGWSKSVIKMSYQRIPNKTCTAGKQSTLPSGN